MFNGYMHVLGGWRSNARCNAD